jgi:hypothetical protein|tara:strand:- start:1674 stop:1982 length:309 start_codon:yes stop_codon:yes gene_type:complete
MVARTNTGRRSSFAQIIITHKGKPISTSVGSPVYEDVYGGSQLNFTRTPGNIPFGFDHRPDLISNLFLDTPASWWIICERNAIFDVFEQLNAGDNIQIPVKL